MNQTNKIILKFYALIGIPFILYGSYLYYPSLSIITLAIVIYAIIDFRYPLLFLPITTLLNSINAGFIIASIGLSIIVRVFLIKGFTSSLCFLAILEIIAFFISPRNNIAIDFVYLLLSLCLFYIQSRYIDYYYLDGQTVARIRSIKLYQSIFCLILGFSALGFDNNTYIVIGITLILYLARLRFNGSQLILGICIFLMAYINNYNAYIILLVAIIYSTERYYPLVIASLLLIGDITLFHLLDSSLYYQLALLILCYEILRHVNLDYFTSRTSILNMYDNIINNFNDQVLKFASFLDEFERKFITNREELIKFNEAYNFLILTYCKGCQKRDSCLNQNKNEAYLFLKSCLNYGNNIYIKRSNSLSLDFIKSCPFHDEIIIKGNNLKNKYNLGRNRGTKEIALEKQIIGLSNTLRQYTIDLSSKREMHLELFLNFKNAIIDHGFNLILFNIRRIFKDDFWIEVGINNIYDNSLEVIKAICEKWLNKKISIEIIKKNSDVIYFNIVPLIIINVLYGTANVNKEKNNIPGDNYLIKNIDNGQFIAALSDGMGSGYKAFSESKETLEMLDHITEFEINPNTSINILNTFYQLKDTMDQYATLDFIEINRSTREAILFKMGSSNTYLYRNGELSIIYNQNLPFGISDLITKNELTLNDDDCIILASDGICDHIKDLDLERKLSTIIHMDPKQIAFEIINSIVSSYGCAPDDMSIIVLKIEKKI